MSCTSDTSRVAYWVLFWNIRFREPESVEWKSRDLLEIKRRQMTTHHCGGSRWLVTPIEDFHSLSNVERKNGYLRLMQTSLSLFVQCWLDRKTKTSQSSLKLFVWEGNLGTWGSGRRKLPVCVPWMRNFPQGWPKHRFEISLAQRLWLRLSAAYVPS